MIVEKDNRNLYKIRFLDKYMYGHKGYIAGGCFKNIFLDQKIKDIDMFFENIEDFSKADEWFTNQEDYSVCYENDNVKAYKDNKLGYIIELCRKVFDTPENMLNRFDFTICKFAYYKKKEIVPTTPFDDPIHFDKEEKITYSVLLDDCFFEHLMVKRLVIDNRVDYPVSTFNRMLKYSRYGFTPCKETKIIMLKEIRKLTGEIEIGGSTFYIGID